MAAQPASPVPTISPAEMQILISRSGLVLNPGQMADLVLAWRQVAGLIAGIPAKRSLTDDAAFSFRLVPPGAPVAAPVARPERPAAAKPAPTRKAKRAARPAKAAPKQRAAASSKTSAKVVAKPAPARSRSAAKPKAKASARRPAAGRR